VRSVVQPFRSEHARQALRGLRGKVPAYYFGITLPDTDFEWLRDDSLPPDGYSIEPVRTYGHETLYRFVNLGDASNDGQ
jgi:hypothetical protein